MNHKVKEPYSYGQSPSPKNWHEAAAAVESVSPVKSKHKSGGLLDRLDSIEKQLKDRK
jgi:hypothetical protein